jgi:hypothetical protein
MIRIVVTLGIRVYNGGKIGFAGEYGGERGRARGRRGGRKNKYSNSNLFPRIL